MTDKADEIARSARQRWHAWLATDTIRDVFEKSYASALRSYAAEIEAERDRLKEALKPFAEWSRKLDAEFGDHDDTVIAGGIGGGLSITFGDLRAARRALSPPTPEGDGQTDPDKLARELYTKHTDNDPIVHSNRFPLWSEMSESAKDEWRSKAASRERD